MQVSLLKVHSVLKISGVTVPVTADKLAIISAVLFFNLVQNYSTLNLVSRHS